MVSDAIALSVGTEAGVQKRPKRKWNAAPRKRNAANPTTIINAKPARDHNKEVPKPGLTKLHNKDDRDNKRLKDRREKDQIELPNRDVQLNNANLERKRRGAATMLEERRKDAMRHIANSFGKSVKTKKEQRVVQEFVPKQTRKVDVVRSSVKEEIVQSSEIIE